MTEFGGTHDYGSGEDYDPEDYSFNPELSNTDFAELLAGFHRHCEEEFGASLDIDPDEDPRSHIFQRAIYAATPKSKVTDRISGISAILSDARTDFNAEPLLQMLYTTEHTASRSVVPIMLINFFMPIGGKDAVEGKNLEILAGKVAIAAAFQEDNSRRPEIFVFMDEDGLDTARIGLERAQYDIEKKIEKGNPFVYRYQAPSTMAEILIHSALIANQEAFFQKVMEDPIGAMEEQEQMGEFIFMGVRGIISLSDDSEFNLKIIGNRVKQNDAGIYIPEHSNLIEQQHLLRVVRNNQTGLVTAQPIESFTERLLGSAA